MPKVVQTIKGMLAKLKAAGTPHPVTVRTEKILAGYQQSKQARGPEVAQTASRDAIIQLDTAFSRLESLSAAELEMIMPTEKAALAALTAVEYNADPLAFLERAYNRERDPVLKSELYAQIREARKSSSNVRTAAGGHQARPEAKRPPSVAPVAPAATSGTTPLDALQQKFSACTDPAEKGRIAKEMRELRATSEPKPRRAHFQAFIAKARALQIRRGRLEPVQPPG